MSAALVGSANLVRANMTTIHSRAVCPSLRDSIGGKNGDATRFRIRNDVKAGADVGIALKNRVNVVLRFRSRGSSKISVSPISDIYPNEHLVEIGFVVESIAATCLDASLPVDLVRARRRFREFSGTGTVRELFEDWDPRTTRNHLEEAR